MRVFKNPDSLPAFNKAVITVGSFDGVHKGHQELIERIHSLAKEINGESVLITFEPHPRAVIHPEDKNVRVLTTLEEKIALLEDEDAIDSLVVVPFTREFSMQTATDYIEHFLVGKFHPAVIVIGYNHSFGHHRDGNIELLRKLSPKFNYRVEEISKQLVDDLEVSSTRIRIALQEGDCQLATHLLGHYYSLQGTVVKGDQIGRTIGYPTANISVGNPYKLIPADGIYAVYIYIKDKRYHGMMSIGNRPTVTNSGIQAIEVNIFDFQQDIYNEVIKVEFVQWLRAQEKFNSLDDLKFQIGKDKEESLRILRG
jgi:riboflavin kinase/FMN adenylyltransferase